MEFNKAYNRQEFVSFLRNNFLPEDFVPLVEDVSLATATKYTTTATKLGTCDSLDLVVYEVRHTSRHDARVALSKEAFRLLADEMQERALVAFVPEDNAANYRFSFIEISFGLKDETHIMRTYSNPHRYSFLLGEGIAYYTPNKYLNEKGRVIDEGDLRARFSVETLTQDFYRELSDWYAWAIKIIRFPNDIKDEKDNDKYNHESAIRLITRLIFVWFLKQRHLIPDEFFDQEYIANNLIENFCPHQKDGLFGFKSHESVYYKAILQNLFFAMLNSPITKEGSTKPTERRFRNGRGDYDNNKLMRYERYFLNPQLFVDLANSTVPFLNGGLFDCLDDKDHDIYYDGFSDRKEVGSKLIFPDYLFFGEEAGHDIDLSEYYNDVRKKHVSARGIIDILKRYNFTVEENTPFDKEVSLDPELLGKVFENLLASYVPDTRDIVRKNTGSFYTPREIVQYMVDESLVAHVKRIVGEDIEPEFRRLLQYTDDPVDLSPELRKSIMQSLYECRILDPACGSGAFPMGMLQQMVHILGRIDPENVEWKKMMMDLAVGEMTEAFQADSKEERQELLADIERSFDENINRPDYARKLYLIEHCIYGVDIQPIAIQISKLRFFISLVVDQRTNNDPADNFGIRPLPNLEAKFVAANTLIGLAKKDATLFDTDAIKEKEQALKLAKHKIFSAKTIRTKRKYRQLVNDLRQELASMMEKTGAVGNEEARQLASWDMFDQNTYSTFFDSLWMFGIKDGFDIIIGNPPYNELRDLTDEEQIIYKTSRFYQHAQGGRVNMFQFFYPFAIENLKPSAICSFITQNSLLAEESALSNRSLIFKECTILGIDSFPERDNKKLRVFESAKMSVCICLLKQGKVSDYKFDIRTWKDKYMSECSILHTTQEAIENVYPDELILPITDNHRWKILLKMKSSSNFSITAQAGEIDMTKYKRKFCQDDKQRRVVMGAQVLRYRLTDTPSQGQVQYLVPGQVQLTEARLGDVRLTRIVMQRITGVDSKYRIIATLLPKNFYCANSVNYISPRRNGINLYYLLGVLNSRAVNFFFKQTSTNTNVTGKEIAKFPIIVGVGNIENRISVYVQKILSAKLSGPTADTSEQERAIDLMVYKLYGLTYDEVKVVDPETTITEEEYEREISKQS